MQALVREYIPQAPQHGLYLAPDIPADKLRAAIGDYAQSVDAADVLALYDATRLGSAKDGALFLGDRLVYQNNDLTPAQTIRYEDIVRVHAKRLFLGGRKVELDVNQGRATTTHTLDFSGRPDAAEYVARFLNEAMLASARQEGRRRDAEPESQAATGTDVEAVVRVLDGLREAGTLTPQDHQRLLAVLHGTT